MDKKLHTLIANIEALSKASARGQLDGEGLALLAQLESTMGAYTGRQIVDALRAWRAAGSPTRDPRPPKVDDLGGDSFARDGRTRRTGL